MIRGFDLENPLVCEGIIGDGCGGGRIFYVEDATLFAYDSLTQESMVLATLENVIKIKKKSCIIYLYTTQKIYYFDLSKLDFIDLPNEKKV